ncbi:MAG: TIR domain-containing protein [Chloroflexi bacterium]|nr:TIR domain-containing protein [Chloroflexota bacterium]
MKVFISYSSKNREAVKSLANDVQTAVRMLSPDTEYKVWFDQELVGGQDWWDTILNALQTCDLFIFALSPNSLVSDACDREWNYAHSLNKRILPVWVAGEIIPDDLPVPLQRRQIVDYRSQDKLAFQKLLEALRSLPAPVPLPDPLPPPPTAPISPLTGIRHQLLAERLDFDQQSALLQKLKYYLTIPDEAKDAHRLLMVLKSHADVRKSIADDIDLTLKNLSPEVKRQLGLGAAGQSIVDQAQRVFTEGAQRLQESAARPAVYIPATEPTRQPPPQAEPAQKRVGCSAKIIGVVLGVVLGLAIGGNGQECAVDYSGYWYCDTVFSFPLFIVTFGFFAGMGLVADTVWGFTKKIFARS